MNVGCFSGSSTYADASNLVTSVSLWVGDSTSNVYTFSNPTSTRSWCTVLSNDVVQTSGAAWSGAAKLTGSGSQPYTSWNLVSTVNPETVSFKMKTTFTNTQLFTSTASISILIACNSNYAVSAT